MGVTNISNMTLTNMINADARDKASRDRKDASIKRLEIELAQMQNALKKIKDVVRNTHRKEDTPFIVKIEGIMLGVEAAEKENK